MLGSYSLKVGPKHWYFYNSPRVTGDSAARVESLWPRPLLLVMRTLEKQECHWKCVRNAESQAHLRSAESNLHLSKIPG